MPSRLSQNETITSVGESLASARREQKLTIKDAEQAIKIRAKYITALEKEAFDQILGEAYVVGFIQTYAKWLELDPRPLIEAYRKELELRGEPKTDPPSLTENSSHWYRIALVGAVATLLVLGGLAMRLIISYLS